MCEYQTYIGLTQQALNHQATSEGGASRDMVYYAQSLVSLGIKAQMKSQ